MTVSSREPERAKPPTALPNFAQHHHDSKNFPIETPTVPPEFIRRWLDGVLKTRGVTPGEIRILDVGCGRGDTVAWLCVQGWDAYGIDVNAYYADRGREYLRDVLGTDPERLRLMDDNFIYPFPDGSFDIVMSDQVIEHVGNLNHFAAEVSRVSSPHAVGIHIYPAKWRPVETHLLTPVAHWLPKGRVRRKAISAMLRMGWAAPYFEGYPHADRVIIYSLFSEDETFYRSIRNTVATLARHGLGTDVGVASREKIAFHLPKAPRAALPLLGWLYRHYASVVLYTQKA